MARSWKSLSTFSFLLSRLLDELVGGDLPRPSAHGVRFDESVESVEGADIQAGTVRCESGQVLVEEAKDVGEACLMGLGVRLGLFKV